jgi:hypothetical protein
MEQIINKRKISEHDSRDKMRTDPRDGLQFTPKSSDKALLPHNYTY